MMKSVIFSINTDSPEEIAKEISELLLSKGALEDSTYNSNASKFVAMTYIKDDVEEDDVEEDDVEEDDVEEDDVEEFEVEIKEEDEDVDDESQEEPEEVSPISLEAQVMEIGDSITLPISVDTSKENSVLYATNVNTDGEYVSFIVDENEVRLPVLEDLTNVVNLVDSVEGELVKLSLKFENLDETYGCGLLVEESEESESRIIFGNDLKFIVELITSEGVVIDGQDTISSK